MLLVRRVCINTNHWRARETFTVCFRKYHSKELYYSIVVETALDGREISPTCVPFIRCAV
jgi:hypothetical protein